VGGYIEVDQEHRNLEKEESERAIYLERSIVSMSSQLENHALLLIFRER
jgi:hypothetical protein